MLRAATIQRTIAATILFVLTGAVQAQETYKIFPGKDVNIQVAGTSNVHDWTMSSSTMESRGDFKFDGKNNLSGLTAFSFNVDAKSLKSGKSSMDSRTYKSMKADKFPKILYKLSSAVITQLQKNKYLVRSKGDLTIAGKTQSIQMDLNLIVNADNSISCSGSESLKLTDYNIEPPSFMLGAMKVKNDLTIQFNLKYKK
jgi:polyisoprenoid-binding protein YceI